MESHSCKYEQKDDGARKSLNDPIKSGETDEWQIGS